MGGQADLADRLQPLPRGFGLRRPDRPDRCARRRLGGGDAPALRWHRRRRGGTDYAFNYDGVFTENFVVSARIAQHNEQSIVSGPGASVVGYVDITNPLGDGTTVWGWDDNVSGFGFHQNQEFSRDQYNIDLTYFVDGSTGSHEFKLGYEYEDIGVVNDNWNGGAGQRIYRYMLRPRRP